MFDLENKLIVARKILVTIDHHACYDDNHNSDSDDDDYDNDNDDNIDITSSKGLPVEKYPMLRSSYPGNTILLLRENPWKSFFLYMTGYCDKKGQSAQRDVDDDVVLDVFFSRFCRCCF